jgi:hypothetical protein
MITVSRSPARAQSSTTDICASRNRDRCVMGAPSHEFYPLCRPHLRFGRRGQQIGSGTGWVLQIRLQIRHRCTEEGGVVFELAEAHIAFDAEEATNALPAAPLPGTAGVIVVDAPMAVLAVRARILRATEATATPLALHHRLVLLHREVVFLQPPRTMSALSLPVFPALATLVGAVSLLTLGAFFDRLTALLAGIWLWINDLRLRGLIRCPISLQSPIMRITEPLRRLLDVTPIDGTDLTFRLLPCQRVTMPIKPSIMRSAPSTSHDGLFAALYGTFTLLGDNRSLVMSGAQSPRYRRFIARWDGTYCPIPSHFASSASLSVMPIAVPGPSRRSRTFFVDASCHSRRIRADLPYVKFTKRLERLRNQTPIRSSFHPNVNASSQLDGIFTG